MEAKQKQTPQEHSQKWDFDIKKDHEQLKTTIKSWESQTKTAI